MSFIIPKVPAWPESHPRDAEVQQSLFCPQEPLATAPAHGGHSENTHGGTSCVLGQLAERHGHRMPLPGVPGVDLKITPR